MHHDQIGVRVPQLNTSILKCSLFFLQVDGKLFFRFWIWPQDGRCTLHYTHNKYMKFKFKHSKIQY